MEFKDLQLDAGLAKGIEEAGYITCTPVQAQVLTAALDGADLYVQSQTGTGKTAAYLITILQRLSADSLLKGKKALIMVPTRELAVQVEGEARILAKNMPLSVASFYGGVGYDRQTEQLHDGVDILIGTPGRVIDLQESGKMNLTDVSFLVIDEADRMFDMGFYPDLRTLIKVLSKPENRQTMLFSATLNTYVKNLAWEYTVEAKEITIDCDTITVDEIDQSIIHVSSDEKMKLLLGILAREKPESVIVFCNTKRMSEVVAKRLKINGYECEFIIGDLPQSKRLQVIDSFKRGSLMCLVATDVAARGIDVNDLSMVVNFDLPNEAENYVHRIGRTARAGKTGKAYTFCSEQDVYNLPAIEKYIEAQIPATVVDENMLMQDKSEGMHIRSGRYDDGPDRRDSRPMRGSGRGAVGKSVPRGRMDRPAGAGSARGIPPKGSTGVYAGKNVSERSSFPSPAKNPNVSGSSGQQRRTRTQGGVRGRQNSVQSEQYAQDLSQLSFEERMKVYQQKYAGNGQSAQAQNQRSKPNQEQKKQSNGKNSPYSKNDKERGKSAEQPNLSKKPQNVQRPQNNRMRQPVQKEPIVQVPVSEKKIGFFGKIKSLFVNK